jgi:tetratricopeptide (TPR) repeat protein
VPELPIPIQKPGFSRHWLFLLVIVILSIVIYSNTRQNGFVYDDMGEIVNNQWVRQLKNLFSPCHRYRITETFTFYIDYKLWGLSPFGYHFTNLLFHVLVSISVYFLANLILKNPLPSFFTGSLFAPHPVHTEAISVVSHRQELLAMLFLIISLILYIKAREAHRLSGAKRKTIWIFIFLSLIFYFFATAAKEVALILPVILFLYDSYFQKDPLIRNWKSEIRNSAKWYIPYLLFAGLFVLFSISGPRWRFNYPGLNVVSLGHSLSGGRAYSSILLTQLRGFSEYIRLLFFPNRLCIDYYFPTYKSIFLPNILFSLALLLVIVALPVILFKRYKFISFGIAWFLINLLPVSNIIPKTFFVAERYLYIPSFGFCLAIGFVFWRMIIRKSLRIFGIILFGLVIILYSVRTIVRNSDLKSEHTLWSKTLKDNPMSVPGYANLGAAFLNSGKLGESLNEFRKAIELSPAYAKPYYNLGIAYLKLGRYQEAIDNLVTSIRLDPNSAENYIALGSAYQRTDKHAEAIVEFENALRIKEDANLHHALGISYRNLYRYDEAIKELRRAIALNPNFGEAHNDLGVEYGRKGLYDEAIREFNVAIAKMSNPAQAYHNLGLAYQKKGEPDKTIEAFQKAKNLEK